MYLRTKTIGHWRENKDTHAFLGALSADIALPISVIMESTKGGNTRGGSWLHPKAAIHLAMWLDPKFAVQVIDWTARFISGDLTLMSELTAQHASLNPQHTTFVTVTTGGPGIERDAVSLLHQDNVMAHEDDNSTVRIAEVKVNARTGEEELHVVIAKLKGELTAAIVSSQQIAVENLDLQTQISDLEIQHEQLRGSAMQMNTDIQELASTNDQLQRDCSAKRQRLATTQNQLDLTTTMGRLLYSHYIANIADLEQLATAEDLDGVFDDDGEQPLASSKAVR